MLTKEGAHHCRIFLTDGKYATIRTSCTCAPALGEHVVCPFPLDSAFSMHYLD